ncbi:Bug family tripartite tricarboxylate transporter substrate binding protein [Paraburkholderia acidisoli]|uniref:Tripartite tricarboxylate transporter substrate binding protein n=1 Tax=Paraburkholderia acidisoli TaxID=2571748 RepID=A0A7Z2GNQ4_9BURK|nr:tripartite tricarboxylate transporter substrate binding protein [Paraburkholderia acidisoli]QGZ65098.1 tripartite tricarboxylate transporter substrate binding protein [Paraburkholderia acidisoli]
MTPTFVRTVRRGLVLAAALAAVLQAPSIASAEDAWPSQPIRLIVPFSAGGSTDVLARALGQGLGTLWKQSVVVDNRPGAGGMIAAEVEAKSAPDGYTLMLASGSMFTVNQYIYKKLPYTAKDFSYITTVASNPMVVAVAPSLPIQNLQQLISYGKTQHPKLNFGSAGIGSQVHMADEAFAGAAGIPMVHVPYKGEVLALNDLMADRVQVVLPNIAAAVPFMKGKTIKVLAVTGDHRSSAWPDIPTVSEAGLPGFNVTGWFALVAPAGTPANVINKIQQDTVKVLAQPETRQRLAVLGMDPVGDTPQQLQSKIATESAKWQKIVSSSHISAN